MTLEKVVALSQDVLRGDVDQAPAPVPPRLGQRPSTRGHQHQPTITPAAVAAAAVVVVCVCVCVCVCACACVCVCVSSGRDGTHSISGLRAGAKVNSRAQDGTQKVPDLAGGGAAKSALATTNRHQRRALPSCKLAPARARAHAPTLMAMQSSPVEKLLWAMYMFHVLSGSTPSVLDPCSPVPTPAHRARAVAWGTGVYHGVHSQRKVWLQSAEGCHSMEAAWLVGESVFAGKLRVCVCAVHLVVDVPGVDRVADHHHVVRERRVHRPVPEACTRGSPPQVLSALPPCRQLYTQCPRARSCQGPAHTMAGAHRTGGAPCA